MYNVNHLANDISILIIYPEFFPYDPIDISFGETSTLCVSIITKYDTMRALLHFGNIE